MKFTHKKIHIIGSTGSGKTYLAREISKRLHIPFFELDDVVWNGAVELSGKNSPEVRDKILEDIINKEQWIIEGVYHKWVGRSFEEADVIIFLSPRPMNRAFRIITRFIKQRTKLERSKYRQTLKGLIEMLKWNSKFDADNKKKIHEMLEKHKEKLIVVKSNKEMILRVAYECDIRLDTRTL